MARRKTTKIPYMMMGGAALGAVGASLIDKVTVKVPQIAANPMIGGVVKVGVGVGIVLYGGKSELVKGIGYGVAAQGGKQVIESSGLLNGLGIAGLRSRQRGMSAGAIRSRNANILGVDRGGAYDMPQMQHNSRRRAA